MKEMIRRVDICKEIIDRSRPFEMPMLKEVQDFYRISTTWSSNALEGNTLTIGETKVLIEDGITVGGKPLRHTLEAIGHARAYDYMFELMGARSITIDNMNQLHKLFYNAIAPDEAGHYRTIAVRISGSELILPSPEEVPEEMEKLEQWMRTNEEKLHPVVYAAELHRRFVVIHPHADGNGRTARLLMNTALIQRGYLPCVISPVLRLDYIQSLEGSNDILGRKGNPEKFIKFISEVELETQKDFIQAMKLEHPDFKKQDNHNDMER